MKTSSFENKYQYLGQVYQLIEQFELISRTDLAKLSGFAPASITNLTKKLIEANLILERTAQNLPSRGRPAVGLSLSPFHWQLLCMTLSSEKVILSLCDLSGKALYQEHYTIDSQKEKELEQLILDVVTLFCSNYIQEPQRLLAISVSVIGKLNRDKTTIIQLGSHALALPLHHLLSSQFKQPIILNEHFQLWLLAESTLGSLIGHNDAIFLQLDNTINLSVLLRGELIHKDEHKRMNVDKMLMPNFGEISEKIGENLSEMERFQLANQISFEALINAIDYYLPNDYVQNEQKIAHLCELVLKKNPQAQLILEHISNNLAYVLGNLINIFSTEKIMLSSPLLAIKQPLFVKIQEKLTAHLHDNLAIDLMTSQYEWDNPLIPAIAIKYEIYAGNLIQDIIQM